MRRNAQLIGADENILKYSLINGFRPRISRFVQQQRCESIDEIVEAARIAELTTSDTDDVSCVVEKLEAMQQQMQRLVDGRSSYERRAASVERGSTPEQDRRVRFASPDENRRQQQQQLQRSLFCRRLSEM